MEHILVGLIGIGIGALVAAFGTRGFYLLLPLWAAVSGFLLGAGLVAAILGEGFLATVTGWIAGVGLGLVFAVIAGVFYYAAVMILAGAVGFGIGSGLLAAFGVEPGVVTSIAGAVVAAGLVILAVLVDAPTILVAVYSAFGGSAIAVAGAWLLLGRTSLETVGAQGPLGSLEGDGLALVLWLGLGCLALGYQLLEQRRLAAERTRATAAGETIA